MKILLTIFLFFPLNNGFQYHGNKTLIIQAIHDITKVLFTEPQIPFDVIIYNTSSADTNNIIARFGSQITFKIFQTSSNDDKLLNLTQSALIFTQNQKDVRHLLNRTYLRDVIVAKPLKFLIHSNEKIQLESIKIAKPYFDEGHIGHFSYFMYEELNEIYLKTLEWFTEQNCHMQQSITINTFSKLKGKWENELKIDEKFRNFHNCTLTAFSQVFMFNILDFIDGTVPRRDMREFEIKIVDAIAHHGNFTPQYFWDASENLLDIYFVPRQQMLKDDCHVGTIFWQDYMTFITSPADNYTSYEKLILTFDQYTWYCILATLIGAFATIAIVSNCRQEIQDLVFGENVASPSMNVIGLFFGLGQTTLPQNNFARIIFVVYIMYCLVITTAYHGIFFELMTTDVKKPVPHSIEDINSMGWTNNVWIANSEQLEILKKEFFPKFIKEVMCHRYSPLAAAWVIALLGDVNSRMTFFIAQREIDVLRYLFANPPYKMDYAYNSMLLGISTTKNNFIFGVTEEVISDMSTGGILQHFVKYVEEFVFRPRVFLKPYEPEVFNLEKLEFGFVIWLITCAFALLAFIGELLVFFTQNLIGLWFVLRFIRKKNIISTPRNILFANDFLFSKASYFTYDDA